MYCDKEDLGEGAWGRWWAFVLSLYHSIVCVPCTGRLFDA